jgi:bacterial/archaeal transporter family-2 protein
VGLDWRFIRSFLCSATIGLIPRIGAASTLAFILTGHIIASVFGLLGVHVQPISVSFIIKGVLFVQKY